MRFWQRKPSKDVLIKSLQRRVDELEINLAFTLSAVNSMTVVLGELMAFHGLEVVPSPDPKRRMMVRRKLSATWPGESPKVQ